ncbi:MAG TPA: ABC transporter permease [Candidatus Eisenbacteria bacterium]|jgi:molybdate transport system permease protein
MTAPFRTVALLAGGILLAFLALPLVALLVRVPAGDWLGRLGEAPVRDALALSVTTSLSATAIVVLLGTPLAYRLALHPPRGQALVLALIDLPMVLPPTVAGVALLLAFGRVGLAGRALAGLGISLPFTTLAVVMAQVFMSAPFYVSAARTAFGAVDRRLLEAAATLRASEATRFFRVLLPLAAPGLVAGATLASARALGEFGATIMFAGNLAGVTRTLPLAVYTAMQSDLDLAVVLSVLLLVLALLMLLALRLLSRPLPARTGPDARS